jgi:hypothetical protein
MATKSKKPVRRMRKRTGEHGQWPPPLSWWRNIRGELFTAGIAAQLREHIAVFAIIGEPSWNAAAAGDAASAVRLALTVDQEVAGPVIIDLVMTALLACAAEGDAAACLSMSYALRRRPGAGQAEARIATSWLVRNFTTAMKRTNKTDRSRWS